MQATSPRLFPRRFVLVFKSTADVRSADIYGLQGDRLADLRCKPRRTNRCNAATELGMTDSSTNYSSHLAIFPHCQKSDLSNVFTDLNYSIKWRKVL